MNSLTFLVGLLLVWFIAVQLIITPLLLKRRTRFPLVRALRTLDTQPIVAELDAQDLIALQALAELGFEPVAATSMDENAMQASLLLFQSLADTAALNVSTLKHDSGLQVQYVEFVQEFEDGMVLDVNNSDISSVFPTSREHHIYRYPHVSVSELFSCFNRLRQAAGGRRTMIQTLEQADPVLNVERRMNRELESLVRVGYLVKSSSSSDYSLSLGAAFSLAFKIAWPVRQLRNALEIRRAQRAVDHHAA